MRSSNNMLSRWLIEHFESEDYTEIIDYISNSCDLDQLHEIMELCNERIHDFSVLAKLASRKTSEKLRETGGS